MTPEQVYYTLLVILQIIRGHHTQQKVHVGIYYEALCPDSRRFIAEFYPQYNIFSNFLNVHFIPFGKASINEDGSNYTCQHGKDECIRNIIHACALDMLEPGNAQIKFVNCSMIEKSLVGHKECVAESNLQWINIQDCANGEKGLQLTLRHQNDTRTSTDGPTFVPTVIFNNSFSQYDQNTVLYDPATVICKYLTENPLCKQIDSSQILRLRE